MKIKGKQIISVMLVVIMLACSLSIASSAAVSLFCPVGSIGMGTSNGYSSGHQGIDLAQGKGGSPVYAAIGGTVVNVYKCTSTHQSLGDCDGFGTGLIIQGTDGMYYQYAHMQANSIPSNVYVGASVSKGQQVGNVGMTGWATGYHLHFQIGSSRWSGAVNPLTYGSYSTSGGTKTLTVYFNANGGSVEGPSDFYLYNNIIYKLSDLSPRTQIWTYNEPKSSTGLVNASSFTLYRTGYKFSGWGTSSSGGKVFDEDDTSLRPSDICPSVANGSTSITLYAQWTPNKLTVNYYSNYADKSFSGALNTVSSSKNVLVRTATYKYNEAFGGGLHDYSNSGDSTYLGKDGYKGTGYWNTKSDGTGIRVNQSTLFANGQALAKALGKDITNSNATVYLYPEWECIHAKTTVKNAKTATCAATGYTGDTYCNSCNAKTKTGTTIAKNASNHVGGTTVKNATTATCTVAGYTGDTYCNGCNAKTKTGTTIAMKNHTDSNNDGYCDNCKAELTPHTPTNPTEPSSPSQTKCTCGCHNSGISLFFWKILNFFHKILGLNKYKTCACGISHW